MLKTHNVIPQAQIPKATVISGTTPTKEAYSFQAFPTTRYHPDGSHKIVKTEDDLDGLGPEWRDTPYPARPEKHSADATQAVVSLADDHDKLRSAFENLKASNDALLNDKSTLQLELEEVQGQLKEAQVANGNLQKQLAMVRGQLAAAKKKDPAAVPDVPSAEPEGKKD